MNYKVKALVNGSDSVIITAYKPLPHTGGALEIKSVEAGGDF